MARWTAAALLALVVMVPAAGHGQSATDPFLWRNSAVVAATTGLPRARSAVLPDTGGLHADLLLEFSSHFAGRTGPGREVWLDGETASLVGRLEYGLAPDWAASIELTALQHSGGFLDGLVNQWHDWFGLPDGGRDDVANDQLLFFWVADGEPQFVLNERERGMADLRLGLAHRIHASSARDLTLRLDAELPSGSASGLRGSGGVDLALSVGWTEHAALAQWGVVSHAGLGVLRPGGGEILGDSLQNWVGIGYWTLAWALTDRFVIKGQLDGHTRIADTGLREVGGWSLQGGLGIAWQFARQHAVEFAIYEDLRPDSAPDVSFQFALRSRF